MHSFVSVVTGTTTSDSERESRVVGQMNLKLIAVALCKIRAIQEFILGNLYVTM
jgi:hypothetical protein